MNKRFYIFIFLCLISGCIASDKVKLPCDMNKCKCGCDDKLYSPCDCRLRETL